LKGDERLHDKEIVWLLSELILANTDNVSASLEWTIAHLMANPHLQRKIHQEIDHVCGQRSHVSINCLFFKNNITTIYLKNQIFVYINYMISISKMMVSSILIFKRMIGFLYYTIN
jgi:cytochrome P450